jgi:hypothetical protein
MVIDRVREKDVMYGDNTGHNLIQTTQILDLTPMPHETSDGQAYIESSGDPKLLNRTYNPRN